MRIKCFQDKVSQLKENVLWLTSYPDHAIKFARLINDVYSKTGSLGIKLDRNPFNMYDESVNKPRSMFEHVLLMTCTSKRVIAVGS